MDNYRIQDDELYYHKKGSEEWKKVPQTQKERERIIEACHSETEGIHSNYTEGYLYTRKKAKQSSIFIYWG